ncbi:MAG: glycosyltransferase family 2 protein [Candidatus Omnitrophica bacterium]|nr:glycosyltransferase family 2 protein [Candidatus Omnitrophota bacterium]
MDKTVAKKSSSMFLTMLGMWCLCILYFNPRFIVLLAGPESIAAKIFLCIFLILLDLFWFYVFFHLTIIGFSYFFQSKSYPAKEVFPKPCNEDCNPSVALLYTTRNDFQEQALLTHLNQDYSRYHIFVLDDSDLPEYKARIDDFSALYPKKVSVIRRLERGGFKAGNLNNALRKIGPEYEFFSVSDSDTFLPQNYITRLLPFISDPAVAFAQSAQRIDPKQESLFAQFLGINTDIHFKHYASTKNRFGFVMWYGHGALMRRDVWEKIGGFPEIVTEDLAYSMLVRQAGYSGVFVDEVVCREDFPPTYKQYRKRNEKWIRGTTECLLKFFPSFFKCPSVPWFEKMDVLVSGVSLLLDFPFLCFMIITGILLPFSFPYFQFQGPMFKMPVLIDKAPLVLVTQLKANLFWSWDIFIMMLLAVFAPIIPVFIDYRRCPRQIARFTGAYIYCFFALQFVSSFHVLITLFTGRTVFPVTGEKENKSYDLQKDWVGLSHANLNLIFCGEFLMGIFFLILGLATYNIWFLPVAFALCISPFLFKWNMDLTIVKYAVFLPLVMTLGIIYFIGRGLPWM